MMAYQAVPYAAQGAADSSYYKDYYAAYGCYDGAYSMAAYYQQQGPAYGVAGVHYQQSASEVSTSAQAPPPPPPEPAGNPQKTATSDKPPLPGSAADAAPPLPSSQSDASPPPPPPPPPPPLPSQESSAAQASSAAAVPSGEGPAPPASADAYAQWYAQNYGAYYGAYTGYEQQWHAYWQQQQQQHVGDAYSYAAGAYAQQPQQHQPAPQPDLQEENSAHRAGAASSPYSFNAQPPPSGLYASQQAQRLNQGRNRTGPTGPNTVPIGPRSGAGEPSGASVAGAPSVGKHQPAIVIRPQLPLGKRAVNTATPSYISVDSSSAVGTATASCNPDGRSAAVAAAVAAGAASAAAAASAAKAAQSASGQGAGQYPPSFAAWVTRCFNAARLRGIPDSRVSEKLMSYLEQVKKEGKLWTTDWDTYPMMLPDGPTGQQDGGSVASNQVLLLDGTPSRKRTRWGAVPESQVDHERRHSHDHHQPANGYRKRGHDADSDEENRSAEHGHGDGVTPKQSVQHLGGAQTMSNRKRKKLLQLEQQQQQHLHSGRRGGRGAVSVEELRREARVGRFGNGRATGTVAAGSAQEDYSSGMDMSDEEEVAAHRFAGQIVGTCQALEKSYFRLTSKPDPATVRPEPVLERALERLVCMIARGEASYFYSLDQFKGMRQDCTVQHLRNGLAVRVYEAHARSSLEYGDTAEFNQCQARLGHLYAEGQPGCMAEFTAYRVIYETVHCATAGQRGGGMAKALMHTIRNIPRELMGTEEIRHALQVREAVMTYNYAAFFRLYASAPHLGRAIMDVVAEPMRWSGLNAFVKACDLPLPVAELAQLLGFFPRSGASAGKAADSESKPLPGCMRVHLVGEAASAPTAEEGTADCAAWLRDHGAAVVEKGTELVLDTKASRGKLFVPEVTAKVAHGDENLSVNDFLSQAQRNLAV